MAKPSSQPRIAIIVDEAIDDSSRWMVKTLSANGCRAEIIRSSQLSPRYAAHTPPAEPLECYELVIYRYRLCFASIAAILEQYDGKLIVYYCADIALSNLRAYPDNAALIRPRELARQQFCEWVQANAQRVYWLADSAQAAADLIAWGVGNVAHQLSIMPPRIALEPGIYSSHTKPRLNNTLNILLADRLIPESGQLKILRTIHHYQQSATCNIELHIAAKTEPLFETYRQEIDQLARQLGMAPHVHTDTRTATVANTLLLQADIMITTAGNTRLSVAAVQAQAMGLAIFEVSKTEPAAEAAERLAQTLRDPAAREQLVLQGYRNINQQHTALAIEQRLLDAVTYSLISTDSK